MAKAAYMKRSLLRGFEGLCSDERRANVKSVYAEAPLCSSEVESTRSEHKTQISFGVPKCRLDYQPLFGK